MGLYPRWTLARHTELGLSTITYIVDELLRDGIVGKAEWGIEWRAGPRSWSLTVL